MRKVTGRVPRATQSTWIQGPTPPVSYTNSLSSGSLRLSIYNMGIIKYMQKYLEQC